MKTLILLVLFCCSCGSLEEKYQTTLEPNLFVYSIVPIPEQHMRNAMMAVRAAYQTREDVDVVLFSSALEANSLIININEDDYYLDMPPLPREITIRPFVCLRSTSFTHQIIHAMEWRLWGDMDREHWNNGLWGLTGVFDYIDTQILLMSQECQR
jgi:hypothetical protein